MDEITPDDTIPDEAYADTIAELAALVDMTLPDFPVPHGIAIRLGRTRDEEE